MSNLRIIFDNAADAATLTASPAVAASLPVTNLQLVPRAKVMRSTSAAAQQIKGTWSAGRMLSACALWRHNLTSAAAWRLELFSDAAWTNTVYDSGAVICWPGKALGDLVWGVDPLGASVFTGWGRPFSAMWFDAIAASSFRVTLTDAANPDGYLEAARLVLGLHLEPGYNMSYGYAPEWRDDSTQERTDGGSLRSDAADPYRRLRLRLDWLSDAERPKWFDAMRTAGKRKDIFISLHPEAGGMLERDHSFAAKLVSSTPLPHARYNTHAIELELEET